MTELKLEITIAKQDYNRLVEILDSNDFSYWLASSSNTVAPVDNIVESEEKWIKFHKQRVMFGYEDHKKEGIIEGYHPLWGVVIFVPSNVLVPYHYVREELIEWPKKQTK